MRSVPLGPLAANAYVLADREGGSALVVDPGDPEIAPLAKLAAKMRVDVTSIVLTHGHFDHAGGLRAAHERWPVPIRAHPGDREFVLRIAESAAAWGVEVEPAPDVEFTLKDGDVIGVGTESVRVVHAPGHSPGGVMYVGDGFAIVGDLIFDGGVGRTDLPGSSSSDLMRSITERVFTMADQVVLHPGHGGPTTVGREKRLNPFVGERGMLKVE